MCCCCLAQHAARRSCRRQRTCLRRASHFSLSSLGPAFSYRPHTDPCKLTEHGLLPSCTAQCVLAQFAAAHREQWYFLNRCLCLVVPRVCHVAFTTWLGVLLSVGSMQLRLEGPVTDVPRLLYAAQVCFGVKSSTPSNSSTSSI